MLDEAYDFLGEFIKQFGSECFYSGDKIVQAFFGPVHCGVAVYTLTNGYHRLYRKMWDTKQLLSEEITLEEVKRQFDYAVTNIDLWQ